MLEDEATAAALIDRVLIHCHIVNIRGNFYRMRQHTGLWQQLKAGPKESSARFRGKAKEGRASRGLTTLGEVGHFHPSLTRVQQSHFFGRSDFGKTRGRASHSRSGVAALTGQFSPPHSTVLPSKRRQTS